MESKLLEYLSVKVNMFVMCWNQYELILLAKNQALPISHNSLFYAIAFRETKTNSKKLMI